MASQRIHELRRPENARQVWDKIEQRWAHRTAPEGHRFLGSIRITQDETNLIWRSLQESLMGLDELSYEGLKSWFGYDLKQSWLKLLVFGMSEYAYYGKEEEGGFWQGWHKCIGLANRRTQNVDQTFRKVIDQGINVLGLVRSKGGYKYVSPLRLQSGIPQQNLSQFADLLQEVSCKWDWWEIAHTDDQDLSNLLLNFCQTKYSHWRTLIKFLEGSCSENEPEAEPISGRLVKGLAIVALELERQGQIPEDLRDDNKREILLKDYYLPHNFFLRDWQAIIQVLTPRPRSSRSSRTIVSLRKKPLALRLDIDSLEIQLHLPEQQLWQSAWGDLRGRFCKIPQTLWEGRFPDTENRLTILEQAILVKQVESQWVWQLQDHRQQEQLQWQTDGVEDQKAYLLFDAWTGNRIHPNNPNQSGLEIGNYREIYCFIPKTSKLSLSQGIEVLDSCVPCSLKNWRGQLLALKVDAASITILQDQQTWQVSWRSTSTQQPILIGLQLKQQRYQHPIYLEMPTLWGIAADLGFKLQIEDLTCRDRITPPDCSLSESVIQLKQWIQTSGLYELHFWNSVKRYSYRFELQLEMPAPETQPTALQITTASTGTIQSSLVQCPSSSAFWAEQIIFSGLWPFEKMLFQIGQETLTIWNTYVEQAEASGCLKLNLAKYYASGNGAFWLKYQRYGAEPQLLLQMPSFRVVLQVRQWTATGLEISAPQTGQTYHISCWNLLTPMAKSISLTIQGCSSSSQMISLDLPVGIYYLQLEGIQPQSLGCWCNSQLHDLPDAVQSDSDLENYCYTILGNEAVKDFMAASQGFDFDIRAVRGMAASLQEERFYLPTWLDRDLLLQKLQGLIRQSEPKKTILLPSQSSISQPVVRQPSKPLTPSNDQPHQSGNWYLLTTQRKKRDIFLRLSKNRLQNQEVKNTVLEFAKPENVIYEDLVLVRLINFNQGRILLKQFEYFSNLRPNPLSLQEVDRMLGR